MAAAWGGGFPKRFPCARLDGMSRAVDVNQAERPCDLPTGASRCSTGLVKAVCNGLGRFRDGDSGRTAFVTALAFFGVVAGLGALLRWAHIRPIAGFDYGHWLHAHSHTAFLGFVFNAFFAFSLAHFLPDAERPAFRRLFVVLQIAVLGMLATFPVQGYAPASIAFSTLHMIGAGVFAWRLWRNNTAAPGARAHLRVALAALVLSGLGPLALGPLAALGLRDTPAYSLCIYFYLHAQYNGWFLFFLQALLLRPRAGRRATEPETRLARVSARWLGAGLVLTLAQSTLWLAPPGWVYAVAAAGGVAQLVGFGLFLRALSVSRATPGSDAVAGLPRLLLGAALAAWILKLVLQTASAAPGLDALVNHRFVVIAFLHLVFLGVVAPAILAFGLRLGWLRDTRGLRVALGVFFSAAAFSELALVAVALGWAPPVPLPWLFFAPTALMAASAPAFFLSAFRARTDDRFLFSHASARP